MMIKYLNGITVAPEIEEAEEFLRIGNTVIMKKKDQIPADVIADIKLIFDLPIYKPVSEYHDTEPACIVNPYRRIWDEGPDSTEEILQLPRCLPPNYNLSGNLVLVCESFMDTFVMVFILDPLHGSTGESTSLFHVLTCRFDEKHPFLGKDGYAVSGGRLYFVGGCYPKHDVNVRMLDLRDQLQLLNVEDDIIDFDDVMEKIQKTDPDHLEVLTYNLTTREWELNPSKLKAPKPSPVVFVYDGKIYALAGRHRLTLSNNSALFEVLDTNSAHGGSRIWKELRPPPVSMEYYSHHFLDEENGTFYLFFEYPDDHRGPTIPCLKLNLKTMPGKKELQWCELNRPSRRSWLPNSRIGHRLRNVSQLQSQGCIVDDILFYYEYCHTSRKPVIIAYDMVPDEVTVEPWVIPVLDEVLEKNVTPSRQTWFLNHMGKLRFCLVINYYAGPRCRTCAVFTLTFDLIKIYKKIQGSNPQTQKPENFEFSLNPIRHGAYHLPFPFHVYSCKKL